MNLFKLMRIVALLSILFVIVFGTWLTERRMAAWDRPILVTVYPILAGRDEATVRYVDSLGAKDFRPVSDFIVRESAKFGIAVDPPFRFQVAPAMRNRPPPIPEQGNTAKIALWSLKMRWWAWRQTFSDGLVNPDIQMFVLFHAVDAEDESGISVGMRNGRYGVVKAYARRGLQSRNLVVFTHELLHVLGATDKYEMATGMPIYPDGYANPDRVPLHPQEKAEIMAGRIAVGYEGAVMPESLSQCMVGHQTAREIGFWARLERGS